jgi:hypothetical protein
MLANRVNRTRNCRHNVGTVPKDTPMDQISMLNFVAHARSR